ncbi:cupin domain-containing protein [Pseudonocardia sp. C8]|uniref:cupin domain-containing protein n=1 Tax=Pseudonocardia sp. C8 TaxID=2762759 RepID=UPI0016434359|nr:cupin domain-containing protein [Pseudonocardia sp. C8]MBC3191736.1 cupin domain-containing protein [Pseudonocardia sp. C8]
MTGKHLEAQARVVVSGIDENGRSTIVSDGNTTTRIAAPGFTVMDTWQVDGLPARVDAPSTLTEEPVLDPPAHGLVVRLASFPPDKEFDAAAYAESLDAFHGGDAHEGVDDSAHGGLWHETDTVDVVTVVTGELYAVMETGETLLRPGDTFVTRGVKHIWSNRTDEPVLVVATMMAATR